MYKNKLLIGLLFLVLFNFIVTASTKIEVYNYTGVGVMEKINYSKLGASIGDFVDVTVDDDITVGGILEVDGTTFHDANVQITQRNLLSWGGLGDTVSAITGDLSYDQMTMGLGSAMGRQLIIASREYLLSNFDHDTKDNPVMYIHSGINPDDDNTEWGSFEHDGDDFLIDSGKGDIKAVTNFTAHNTLNAEEDVYIGDSQGQTLFTAEVNNTAVLLTAELSDVPIILQTYSPDGTAWNCAVNNSGVWACN